MKKSTTASIVGYRVLTAAILAAFVLFPQSSFSQAVDPGTIRPRLQDIVTEGLTDAQKTICGTAENTVWRKCATAGDFIGLSGKCAVCPGATTWDHPTLDLYYNNNTKMTLEDTHCDDREALRFCARKAPHGTKEENKSDNYGNATGATDNPRVQLCAYEDPMDGMDGEEWGKRSKYHWHTKNAEAKTNTLTIVGAVLLGPGFAPVGAIILLVAVIRDEYNHVVYNNLGCVELPIAKGPPAFCNDCWHTKYAVRPTLDLGSPSTFLDPKVELNFCFSAINEPVDCVDSNQKFIDGLERQTIVMSPTKANGYRAVKAIDLSYNQNGSTVNDKREFLSEISVANPSQICVYMTKNMDGLEVAPVHMICIPRPGYMPMPKLSRAAGSTPELPKIQVSFDGTNSLVIWPDKADLSKACGTLNQIQLCARRKCVSPAGSALESCATWDNKVCLVGYNTVPLVVADKNGDVPFAANVMPPSNILRPKYVATPSNAFVNKSAIPEISSAGTGSPVKLKLLKDLLLRDAPTPETANYAINDATQTLRQVTPEELGLCVAVPLPNEDLWVKAAAGDHVYTVPPLCKQIKVELWGGGAGGTWGATSGDDFSGGAGGYISALIPVAGSSYPVVVGSGGAGGGNGGDTKFNSGAVIAYGGKIVNGGGSLCPSGSTCTQKDGKSGTGASCSYLRGGAVWNPDTGKFENVGDCGSTPTPAGAGGCGADKCYVPLSVPITYDPPGISGPGAAGKARITCTEYKPINELETTPDAPAIAPARAENTLGTR